MKRTRFPKRIKDIVWRNYNPSFIGRCYACGEQIDYTDFEVGHNRAVTKNGSNKVSNLRPICQGCNKAIGNRMTIEAYRKKYFGGTEVPVPTAVIKKYSRTGIITYINQVPLQLSSLEFDVLLFLLDNKNACAFTAIGNAIQFAYVLHFLEDTPPILQNWIRYGREGEEKETKRRIWQSKGNIVEHDWRDAKRAYNEYVPILQKVLDMYHGKSEHNTLRNFLFADDGGKVNDVVREINRTGRLRVPLSTEIKTALLNLQEFYYVENVGQEKWGIAPYFYKLWSDGRDKLISDYEREKKDALVQLKKTYDDDWGSQGEVIAVAERYMETKYTNTILDFYLLLHERRAHQSKYYSSQYFVKAFLNS